VIKVISKGFSHNEYGIETVCLNCNTRFAFTLSEAKLYFKDRVAEKAAIPCPICNIMVEEAIDFQNLVNVKEIKGL